MWLGLSNHGCPTVLCGMQAYTFFRGHIFPCDPSLTSVLVLDSPKWQAFLTYIACKHPNLSPSYLCIDFPLLSVCLTTVLDRPYMLRKFCTFTKLTMVSILTVSTSPVLPLVSSANKIVPLGIIRNCVNYAFVHNVL